MDNMSNRSANTIGVNHPSATFGSPSTNTTGLPANNGTPLTLWYVLDTSSQYTGMVDEPLRKIGIYADSVANLSVPTRDGADSIDSFTFSYIGPEQEATYPSEMNISYKGWHPKQVKISANNSWT